MSLVKLLRKWSEQEPDRCTYSGGMISIRGWTLTHEHQIHERLVMSEIQSAVQEAIESRGWNWYLGKVYIEPGTYYKSRISVPLVVAAEKAVHKDLDTKISTHSPTLALLLSYLSALSYVRQTGIEQLEAITENSEVSRDVNSEIDVILHDKEEAAAVMLEVAS